MDKEVKDKVLAMNKKNIIFNSCRIYDFSNDSIYSIRPIIYHRRK